VSSRTSKDDTSSSAADARVSTLSWGGVRAAQPPKPPPHNKARSAECQETNRATHIADHFAQLGALVGDCGVLLQ